MDEHTTEEKSNPKFLTSSQVSTPDMPGGGGFDKDCKPPFQQVRGRLSRVRTRVVHTSTCMLSSYRSPQKVLSRGRAGVRVS